MPRPIGGGVCEVDLSRGLVALIDESDAELVSILNWSVGSSSNWSTFYARASRPAGMDSLPRVRSIRMHRYLLGFPNALVDHKDGDGLNNRRSNLRACTASQNTRNMRLAIGSVPFKGVTKDRDVFTARILVDGKRVPLGRFRTALEAALAYDAAAVRYFGEFAATNASLGLLDSASQ